MKKQIYRIVAYVLALMMLLSTAISAINITHAETVDGTAKLKAYNQYSSRYYYKHLSKQQKRLYDTWVEKCNDVLISNEDVTEFQDSSAYCMLETELTDLTYDEAEDTYVLLRMDNPQYFFLPNYLLKISYADGNINTGICVYPAFSEHSARQRAQNSIFKTLQVWQMQVQKCKTTKSKLRKMHDIIIKNVSYDYDVLDYADNDEMTFSQSVCPIFLNKRSLCYGYAAAFSMLCNRNKIKNNILISDVHAWNRVYYNKRWYYVDCTWDDLDMGNIQTWDYFLITRSKALKSDESSEHTVSTWLKPYAK